MTMSMLPTIAGTSATRQPRQISSATLRLQKQLDRARTRSGTESFDGRATTWKPIWPRGHSVSTYHSPGVSVRGGSMRCAYFVLNASASFASSAFLSSAESASFFAWNSACSASHSLCSAS